MCFSAKASFTAAAVLTVLSFMTIKKCSSKNQLFLAVMPLLFAVQQFSEGVLWIALQNNQNHTFWSEISTYIYLSFAFVVWPVWIPLSILAIETKPFRKKLLVGLIIWGAILSTAGLICLLQYNMNANIISNHIVYNLTSDVNRLVLAAGLMSYGAIATLSLMVSSLKNAVLYGLIVGTLFLLALYFYSYAFASVWCFFAAICSLTIYKIIKNLGLS